METLQLTSSDWTTLLGSRFFVRLPRSTVEAILEDTRLSTYEEHDVLFHQGDSIDDVFFVLSGLIRLYRVGKDRARQMSPCCQKAKCLPRTPFI